MTYVKQQTPKTSLFQIQQPGQPLVIHLAHRSFTF